MAVATEVYQSVIECVKESVEVGLGEFVVCEMCGHDRKVVDVWA